MTTIMIIQCLLNIHKKNLFLFPTPTEVAFYATIMYQLSRILLFRDLFEQKLFKSSENH